VYVDNAENRRLGRVGLPHGTAVHSRSKDSSSNPRLYEDNAFNRRLGRVGKIVGTAMCSKENGSSLSPRVYVDNAFNRSLGRVGKVVGTAVHSRNGSSKPKPGSKNPDTELLARVLKNYRRGVPEDLQNVSEDMEIELADQIADRMNRLNFENEWSRSHHLNPIPKTENAPLLAYKGPLIEFTQLKLGEVIGRGSFGAVYHASYDGSVVAVKKLHVSRVSRRRKEAFVEEVNILSKLNHLCIVRFIGACVTSPNLCIVMEYMQRSLHEALHIDRGNLDEFSDEDRLLMVKQTAMGLEYLHSEGVAHCDIKSSNILIDHDGERFTNAKLTDFGLSIMKSETETSISTSPEVARIGGTPRYSAPEVHRGELLNLKEMMMADMFSCALVVFEILFEEEPFAELNAAQLRKQVGERGMRPQLPTQGLTVNTMLGEQLSKCWDVKPTNRPTAKGFLRIVKDLSCVYA